MNLSDIAVLNIIGFDYRCIISLISENENINLLQNADLTEKKGIIYYFENQNKISWGRSYRFYNKKFLFL